jgi:hypothetical protein
MLVGAQATLTEVIVGDAWVPLLTSLVLPPPHPTTHNEPRKAKTNKVFPIIYAHLQAAFLSEGAAGITIWG